MGLQAIEARPKYGSPVFLVDQDTVYMTTARRAVRYGVSFQSVGASVALSPAHRLTESKTIASSRGKSRVVARASVAVAACVLWLFIGAAGDNALCGESDTRAQVFVAAEKGIAQANARRDESLLISQFVETTVVEQKQSLKHGPEKVDILVGRLPLTQPLVAPQGKAVVAPQSAPAAAWERKQALEHEQEWFARALNSSLRGEPDEVRSAAESERIKQKQSLDQERGRADALARELTSLRSELDAGRIAGQEAVQAIEAEIKQKQALDQERDRADALARELTSLWAELDTARAAGLEATRTAEAAKIEQEQALGKERDKTETLARELTSLRADLDTARAAGLEATRTAEAAKIEQEQALGKERGKTETLARELTSLRADLDTARAAGLEATRTAEAAKIEQEQALGKERDKTETLARELTSLWAERDTARAAGLEATRTAEAARIEHDQALGKE